MINNMYRNIRKVLSNIFGRKTIVQVVDLRKGDKVIYQVGNKRYSPTQEQLIGFKDNIELLTGSDKYNKLFVDFPVEIIVIRGSKNISKKVNRKAKKIIEEKGGLK